MSLPPSFSVGIFRGRMEYDQRERMLREELLAEAAESIRGLMGNEDVLAAILTGSAAWGKPNPDGDIDILLITKGGEGVYYRYLIPKFSPVKRRTEHGFIPRAVALKQIEAAYGSNISCSMLEQLKNGRVLFQVDGAGDDLMRRSREAVAGTLVVGSYINTIVELLKHLDDQLARGCFGDAVLSGRRIVQFAVRVLLLARRRTGISKEKHEYRAVRTLLDRDEVVHYEDGMGVRGFGDEDARRVLERAVALVRWVLEGKSVSGRLVEYERVG